METIDDVIAEMRRRWRRLERAGDYRAVFARSYLTTTVEVKRAAERPGWFDDPEWVVRLDVDFARRYFDAFDAFEAGRPCPRPWQLAFEAARARRTAVLQDILLGMNAHIAFDLPHALDATIASEVGADALERHRRDHERLNATLGHAIDDVQRQAAWAYDLSLMVADVLMGSVDERLAAGFIRTWRTRVWEQLLLLRSAKDPATRALVEAHVENAAGDNASFLLEPQKLVPALVPPTRVWRDGIGLARRVALSARDRVRTAR